MILRTGSKPELVVHSALPKVIKLTMGNLVLPRVLTPCKRDFYLTRNPDVTFMPRIIQEYRDEVRKKIVEAAYSLFLHKGYHGTTMSAIAEILGVTKRRSISTFPVRRTCMPQLLNTPVRNWP